jgi:nitrogen regulatory protein P-II 1
MEVHYLPPCLPLAPTFVQHDYVPQLKQGSTGGNMTKVEAIIRPNRFEQVKDALSAIGVAGMTVSEVRGHGRQKGHTENYRGREYDVSLLPKIRVEAVVDDDRVEKVIETIIEHAATGQIGDGKIFLYKAEDAIRIRNRERGDIAL